MTHEEQFRNKVSWISIICAVLVVFLHSYAFNDGARDLFAYHLEFFISRNIAQASVPVFFALSAFLFYRNFAYSRLLSKFRSRFRSLVIPYLVWNIISMIAFYFLSRLPFINTEPFDWTLDTIVDGVIFYRYNLVFWFVFQLILLTYLFPLLYPVLKRRLLAAALFVLLVFLYGNGRILIWRIELKALIFYYFGAFWAVQFQQKVAEHQKASVLGISCFLLSQIMIYSDAAETPLVYILTRLLMIVAVYDLAGLLSRFRLPALLNCSFPIYALHNLILEFFNKVFSFFLSPDSNLILLDYFGSTLATLLIIMAVNRFLSAKLPKVHGFLFGGRGK